MKMISLMIPEQMLEEIRKVSDDTGLSVSEHIRRAIDIYFAMSDEDRMSFLSRGNRRNKEYAYPTKDVPEFTYPYTSESK